MISLTSSVENHRTVRGYTLIEMLIVVVVMAILMLMVVSGFTSGIEASRLRSTEARITSSIEVARQEAVARNRTVELRFYEVPGANDPLGGVAWRSWQILLRDTTGSYNPIGDLQSMDQGIVAHPDVQFSNLLVDPPNPRIGMISNGPTVGGATTYRYAAIEFRPDGSTGLTKDTAWSLSLVESKEIDVNGSATLPQNYRSIVINPFTGATRGY